MTSHVLHRQLKTPMPTLAGGQGVFLTDTDGKRYLDGSGGAAVSCLGHGHPRVINAVKNQIENAAYAHSSFFTNAPAEELAEWLSTRAPDGFGAVSFLAGGSEAMEAALKFARQVHLERGQPARTRIIARQQSYHGSTLGGLSVGGHKARREKYEDMLSGAMSHIEPCYAYRFQQEGETDEAYGKRAAAALEAEIQRLGPETVAAFVAETVVGSTLGAVTAAPGYFTEVRRICDQHGILLILDEVMCGMGRTGALFACSQEDVVPDMIACAKGLGAGYQPIGALLVRSELAESVRTGTGAVENGHTYMAHATACAGALEVQKVIEDDDLLPQVSARGDYLTTLLQDRFAQHPHVGDVRGRGLFIAVEFVSDRSTKEPFAPELNMASRLKAKTFQNGLLTYPANGTVDGTRGDHVLLAPAFIIGEDELEMLADRLDESVRQVIDDIL